ncbi:MAG: murein biosynthesis integral membrane protein MurJ [Deltaproteobacteria bacterium]|nr:murein biosynthesis integral membrane protein MurJ [Deltaproteobacteria bacterium]
MSQVNSHHKTNLFKSIGTISLLTFFSRLLGLVREIVKAHYLGTSFYSDAFTLAFSLPNLFRRLTAEGVMSNAFIPVFCQIKEENGNSRALDFAKNFFWFSSLILLFFTLIFIFLAPWLVRYIFASGFSESTLEITVFLTQLMFFYIVFISLAAVCQGVLNSFSSFWVSAFAPVLLNLCIVGFAVYYSPRLENPATGFAIGVLVGGFFQLIFQIPFLKRFGFNFFKNLHLRDPYIKNVLLLMLPAIFGVGIYQVNIIISNLIATTLKEGSLSSLTFSNRLMELFIGVIVVSIATALLPRFSSLVAQNKTEEVKSNLAESLSILAFITLPVIIGTLMISEEVVTLLFQRGNFDENSMIMTAGALRYHIIGLFFIAWNRILLTGYQSAQNIRITVLISFVVVFVNLVCAFVLAEYMGHLGIAFANSISQVVQTILLFVFLRTIKIRGFYRILFRLNFFKILLNSSLTFILLWYLKHLITPADYPYWMVLLILFFGGSLFYLSLSIISKTKELVDLKNIISRA